MQPNPRDEAKDPRLTATVDLIGRTGAEQFQLRYADDEEPVVWIAVAGYSGGRCEAAGGLSPLMAVLRLAEVLVDGGMCTHCKRPTGFSPDLDTLPLDELVCWYQWDPELKTIRRGCEGRST